MFHEFGHNVAAKIEHLVTGNYLSCGSEKIRTAFETPTIPNRHRYVEYALETVNFETEDIIESSPPLPFEREKKGLGGK